MGMSIEKMLAIKESIKVGSFCKEWWKQLSKVVKEAKLTDFEKILVFTKICCGLISECRPLISCSHDVHMICGEIDEAINTHIFPKYREFKDDYHE